MSTDPFTPEWQAFAREVKLTRHVLSSGLNAIGRADYASKKGEYFVAFFSLSIGIERLCKLNILAAYVLGNDGATPPENHLRKFGHRLSDLISKNREIASDLKLSGEYLGEAFGPIEDAVISCLDSFADAGRGRYANIGAALGDAKASGEDPLRRWSREVGEAILMHHFRGKAAEAKAARNADIAEMMMGSVSSVHHTAEDGTPLRTVRDASLRTAENAAMQKYGRYYSFRIIRVLADTFSELTATSGYKPRYSLLFGHYEILRTFTVENSFGLNRRSWPLDGG